MRKQLLAHRDLIQIIISMAIAIASAVDMIGRPGRLVTILTLTAGAIGTGIGIGVTVERKRQKRLAGLQQ
jgi:hypothetical protein